MTGINWIRTGAVLGFLAVTIGAFGAHGLKERLDALGTAATFKTGVEYHMFHTIAILCVGLLAIARPPASAMPVNMAGWSFLVGVMLFSGSLYLLGVTGIKILGAITPLGGVAFLIGWVAFAVAAWNSPVDDSAAHRTSHLTTLPHVSNGASHSESGIKREESSH